MRARAVPSPRRRAGTVAHCSPGHPGRRSALGAWRGPGAICMRSSHKGSRSGAPGGRAPPGPGAILRPGGGNSSPPAPGPPLRVNGRAPPPSEALCVSGLASWARGGRASSAGGAPAPAPLAHANQPGSATGRAARPGAPTVPARSPPASPCCREAPKSPARSLHFPPLRCPPPTPPPPLLPGAPQPSCRGPSSPAARVPLLQCERRGHSGGSGWPGSRGLGPCPCSGRTLVGA